MKRVLFLIGLLVASACSYGQIILQPGTTVTVTCPTGIAPAPTPQPPNPVPVPPGPPQPGPAPQAAPCAQFLGNFLLYNYCLQGLEKPTPAPTGNSAGSDIPTSGFVIQGKGNVLRNHLSAGQTYNFVLPNTAVGEVIYFKHGEMPGTPDSMRLTLTILGPQGQILHGPTVASSRFWSTQITSPGGSLTYRLVPSEDGWLIVTRN